MQGNKFIQYANSFQAIARLELEGITRLLDYLSHPEKDLKFVHVAGTNGKGSVCAFLQEIFTHDGLKCGKYTSPNMVSVCERISINGENINEQELNGLLKKVEKFSLLTQKDLGTSPTQFEIWTAAAFYYFKEKKCDVVILETGLGGERDATNVIPTPLASVITHIDIDHTEYLGNSMCEIAKAKAGIIKENGITIACGQYPEALKVIEDSCKEKNNPLYIASAPIIHSPTGTNEMFSYKGIENLQSGISGLHQIENACVAIEVALKLGASEEAIRYGIENARNMGRFEIISQTPTIIFDGAHNPDGMNSLVNSLKRYYPDKKPTFVMGFMRDKDISSALKNITDAYEKPKAYAVSVLNNPRAATSEELSKVLNQSGIDATPCDNITIAIEKATESNDLVAICGSLYLYKDLYDNNLIN